MWAADVRYFNEGKGDIFYGFPMEDDDDGGYCYTTLLLIR